MRGFEREICDDVESNVRNLTVAGDRVGASEPSDLDFGVEVTRSDWNRMAWIWISILLGRRMLAESLPSCLFYSVFTFSEIPSSFCVSDEFYSMWSVPCSAGAC